MTKRGVEAKVRTFFPVLCLLASCQPGDQGTPEYLVYDTIGDTLVVRDQVASEWERPRGLVLDRMIGGIGAEGEFTFGRVGNIAVEPSGAILVEDTQAKSVVRFGSDGSFADSIGRRGEGPGEYLDPRGIAVFSDGRIVVRDNRLFVIHIFDSTGTFIGRWPLRELLRNSWGLEVDQDDTLAVRADFSDSDPLTQPDEGLVLISPEGTVSDSIPSPATPGDGTELWGFFHPKKYFIRYSSDFTVVGVSDRYHFDILRLPQTIRVEQPYEPVPVSDGERGAFDIDVALQRELGGLFLENLSPPPDYKAAYSRIMVTRTGQIWVFRHGRGEQWSTRDLGGGHIYPFFRESLQIDVFDRDGRFLGVVEGDANIDPKVVSNDTVWAVVTGGFDEHFVARYIVR